MSGFLRRFVRVLARLLPFFLAFLRDRRRFLLFGRAREVDETTHRERAQRLQETLLSLGPTFIKVGQVLSVRPDLVPKVYREELSALQDTVPPDAGGDPRQVLDAEFEGEPFDDVREFAGGSLAYVYRARYEGDDVALKVRRPGLASQIRTDLRVVNVLLPPLVRFVPEQYEYSVRNLVDDFETVIFQELDLDRERRIMTEIRDDFVDDERVRIPGAYPDVSTERVLTMEFLQGTKITDTERLRERGFDLHDYAERICHVYLEMGLEHGVYQADPHPGNLAVDDEGRLVIYDFGMSDRLTGRMREHIIDLYRGMARRDVDSLLDTLEALDVLDPDADREEVRQVVSLLIEELQGREGLTWHDIVAELSELLHDFPFRIPPDVMLLIRVGTVGEGVCRQLDPQFDFVSQVQDYLAESGLAEESLRAVYEQRREQLAGAAEASLRLPEKVESMTEAVTESHERADARSRRRARTLGRYLAYGLVVSGLAVAAALLAFVDPRYGLAGFVATALAALAFLRFDASA